MKGENAKRPTRIGPRCLSSAPDEVSAFSRVPSCVPTRSVVRVENAIHDAVIEKYGLLRPSMCTWLGGRTGRVRARMLGRHWVCNILIEFQQASKPPRSPATDRSTIF